MNHFLEWSYAILCKRRALVAAGGDWWTTPIELYAHESGPLWAPVNVSGGR